MKPVNMLAVNGRIHKGVFSQLITQGIVTERTGTLGLLACEVFGSVLGRQIDHILQAAYKRNYQVVMGPMHLTRLDDQAIQVEELLSQGIDGFLIRTRGAKGEFAHILQTIKRRVPVVTFHNPTQVSGVVLDDTTSFCEATEHLIRLGHERVGFIGADWDQSRTGSAKGKGYLLAMQKHGLIPKRIPSEISTESGYRLGKRLGDGLFTALVCRNDYTAIGVCRGLQEAGIRVPEDVAVVGSGAIDMGEYVTPALTTLATPYEAIAEAAMELMLEQLAGRLDDPRQITLKSPLVVRESCGAHQKNNRKDAHCPE